jgi:uncharacterized protein YbjT (DUF2867 family)
MLHAMNILILGATGFIGSTIAAHLAGEGHVVTGLGRNPGRARLKQPGINWIRADLSDMGTAIDWTKPLAGQQVVVNCAGALQDGLADDIAATQAGAMLALYQAAKNTSPLIVQISARTSGGAASRPFLATKRRADEALAASGLPHVILRPALVLGRNAHGGSALLRALAALPFCLPLIHADSPAETVSLDDIARAVSDAITGHTASGTDIHLSTGETLTLADLVLLHRQWLGLPPAPIVRLPAYAARPVTALADLAGHFGWRSPLRSTAIEVMSAGVSTSDLTADTRQTSQSVSAMLSANPSGTQDLWFARLYLLKPVMIAGLSLFWLLSGLIPLFSLERASAHFLPFLSPASAMALTLLTCLFDILLGTSVLVRPFARNALIGMLAVSLAYIAGACILEPSLWLDPLGPMVKVLPSLVLTLATLAILDER